jgi:cytochrome c1
MRIEAGGTEHHEEAHPQSCSPAWFVAGAAFAASGGIAWDKFPKERVNDLASLQNGAKLFVNYCLNCHEAAFACATTACATSA